MDLTFVVLLGVSTLSGAVLGITCFPWPVLLVAATGLMLLCVTALQLLGVGVFSTAAVTVLCVSVHQIAYLVGGLLWNSSGPPGGDGLREDAGDPRAQTFAATKRVARAPGASTNSGLPGLWFSMALHQQRQSPRCVECGVEMRRAFLRARKGTSRSARTFRCDRCGQTLILKRE